MTILIFICNRYSYIHDFILSDNRHYIFYYFRKIYLNDKIRYSLLIYISFLFSLIITDNVNLIRDNKMRSFYLCTLLCIIPAKLVELRYFAPCYIIFAILICSNKENFDDIYQYIFSWYNILAYIIINTISIYIFIYKPFENKFMNNEISRFMY